MTPLAEQLAALGLRATAATLDDVIALATPVLKHRMALTFAARAEGLVVGDIVARLTQRLG